MSRFIERVLETASRGGPRGLTTAAGETPVQVTWGELHQRARAVAGQLSCQPGEAVAILATDPYLVAIAVQAVWLRGGSVTMLHQPTARTELPHWTQDTLRTVRIVGAELVLLGPPFEQLDELLSQHGVPSQQIAQLSRASMGSDLPGSAAAATFAEVGEEAAALLQLTSGSTAEPKAVRITHGNLLANLEGIATTAELEPTVDTVVSWLPLFHDMGMVGCLLTPMMTGMQLVTVTPADFLARPMLWLELISQHRGTMTAAPNFAYAMVGRRLARAEDGEFDLSSLRFALNGAEPIDPTAVRAFLQAGARFGLPATSVVPAFGMAEATLAVSFSSLTHGLRTDCVEAAALSEGKAVPVVEPRMESPDEARQDARAGESQAQDAQQVREIPLLGRPLPGLEVSVVDDLGATLRERQVGRLRVRGSSISPGYLTGEGPLSTQDPEGWLDTGDEGYLVDGEVVICGRRKDVIIMGGRNLYPVDIERAAGEVEGVRAGNAAAVRIDAGSRRERFAVVVESRLAGDAAAEQRIRRQVTSHVVSAVDARPAQVVVLTPGQLPKTPSGKLQRAAAGQLIAQRVQQ